MQAQEEHHTSTLAGAGGPSDRLVDSVRPDSLKIKPPSRHCERPRGWLWMRCPHGTDVCVPLKCGHCDACLERRKAKHVARICYAIYEFGPAAQLEFTSRPGMTWPEIMRAWSKMIALIREVNPAAQYAAIKEAGPETGMVHLHVIIVNWKYILQRDLSRWWEKLTGAPVVWVQRVTSSNAAFYVAKHLTKDVARMRNPVTYGRGFPKHAFQPALKFICKMDHMFDDWPLTAVHGWGILIRELAPGCDCFPDARPLHDGERAWLALCCHRWPRR